MNTKLRYVTLPNGQRRRLTEQQIAAWAGMADLGGTASINTAYLAQACQARAFELGLEPIEPEFNTFTTWKAVQA
jgi:hypothetical protein